MMKQMRAHLSAISGFIHEGVTQWLTFHKKVPCICRLLQASSKFLLIWYFECTEYSMYAETCDFVRRLSRNSFLFKWCCVLNIVFKQVVIAQLGVAFLKFVQHW